MRHLVATLARPAALSPALRCNSQAAHARSVRRQVLGVGRRVLPSGAFFGAPALTVRRSTSRTGVTPNAVLSVGSRRVCHEGAAKDDREQFLVAGQRPAPIGCETFERLGEHENPFRAGFDPSLTIDLQTLSAMRSPTIFLWGTNDVYGGPDVARRAADAMPDAELELMPDAGHLCWLDDVDRAATVVRRHLLGT